MKKILYAIFVFAAVSGVVITDLTRHKQYNILDITPDCKIAADFDRDLKTEEDEYIEISGITPLCSEENIRRVSKEIGFPDINATVYLQRLSRNAYAEIFYTEKLTEKSGKYYIGGEKAAKVLLSRGVATANSEKYKKYENKNLIKRYIEDAKNKRFYLLNTKSKKYHTLTCPSGLKSEHVEYLLKEELPEGAKPCGFCILGKIPSAGKKLPSAGKFGRTNLQKVYKEEGLTIIAEPAAGTFKPETACNGAMCRALKNEIDSAKKTIDFAIFDLRGMPEIENALKNAKRRGVKLRIVTNYSKTERTPNRVRTLFPEAVSDGNCVIKQDSKRLMHNKFFIFDGERVFTGSANITDTGLSGFNANTTMLIKNKSVAKIYEKEFLNMYAGKFHTAKTERTNSGEIRLNPKTSVRVFFSPQDRIVTSQILPYVKNAKKYIYVPIFAFTERSLASELIKARARGVDVKLIIDATTAFGRYCVIRDLRAAQIPVKAENFAGKMHMKSVIIDDKYVFTGSANLTKSANVYNDENMLLITSEPVAKRFREMFAYIWTSIPDIYLYKIPLAESYQSPGSCFDGVDNDFDEKIDGADEGCSAKFRPKNLRRQ